MNRLAYTVCIVAVLAAMWTFAIAGGGPHWDAGTAGGLGVSTWVPTATGDLDMVGNDIDNVLSIADASVDPADSGWGKFGSATTVLACENTTPGTDSTFACASNVWASNVGFSGPYFASNAANSATTGIVRGANLADLTAGRNLANTANVTCGVDAGNAFTCSSTLSSSAGIRAGSSSPFFWPAKTECYSNANGDVNCVLSGTTTGATLRFSAGTLSLRDYAGTGAGTFLAGAITASGLTTMTGGTVLPVNTATAPAEPVACGAGTFGRMEVADDSNDTLSTTMCYCGKSDDSTYDWLVVGTNAACPYY